MQEGDSLANFSFKCCSRDFRLSTPLVLLHRTLASSDYTQSLYTHFEKVHVLKGHVNLTVVADAFVATLVPRCAT